MSRITPESAFNALETIHYLHCGEEQKNGCKYFRMSTPCGVKRVKVVPRPSNGSERYFMGVSIPLFDVVDEWIFYFRGESSLFVIPDGMLSRIWRTSSHLKGPHSDQWVFNFQSYYGCIETPTANLSSYRQAISVI